MLLASSDRCKPSASNEDFFAISEYVYTTFVAGDSCRNWNWRNEIAASSIIASNLLVMEPRSSLNEDSSTCAVN